MSREELIEQLRREDELTLLDILGLTSDDLVDSFIDLIDERSEYLIRKYEEEQ